MSQWEEYTYACVCAYTHFFSMVIHLLALCNVCRIYGFII